MNSALEIQRPGAGLKMDARTVKLNRLKLIAIFAVAVIPVILAMVMYFGGVAIPSAKTNKGNLIWPPVPIDALGASSTLSQQNSVKETILNSKKWTLMVTGGSVCDEQCMALIHTVRQVNVSMAKNMDRVSRVLVSGLAGEAIVAIEQSYPQMVTHQIISEQIKAFQAQAQAKGAVFQGADNTPWTVWIVDPLGNVIVQFTDAHDGYDMIHDLKKLLKLSNIG